MSSQEKFNQLQLQHQLQSYQFQYNDLQIKYELSIQRNIQLQSQCEMYQRELEAFRVLFYSLRANTEEPLYSQQSLRNFTSIDPIQAPDLSLGFMPATHGSIFPHAKSPWALSNPAFKRQIDNCSIAISKEKEIDISNVGKISDEFANKKIIKKRSCPSTDSDASNSVSDIDDVRQQKNENPKKRFQYYEWSQHFAALLEYYKVHGTCNVPARDSFECDLPGLGEDGSSLHYAGNLGNWLRDNRQAKRGHGQRKATPEQIAKLQVLVDEGKLLWNVPTIAEESKRKAEIDWPRHYAALLKYYDEHGTCNVPQLRRYKCDLPGMGENGADFPYEGNLGGWLDRQRQSRRGFGSNKITPEQVVKLQILVDEGKLRW